MGLVLGGSRSTKRYVFLCRVAAAVDVRYLARANLVLPHARIILCAS